MKKISRRSFLTAMAAVSAAGVLAACGASSSTASSVVSSVAASSETAASSEAAPESVTIKAFNGAKELVDVEVPFDPQRIAILDLASLDILDELGVGDRVVGTASTSLDYLQSYVTNDSIVNLGNIKEADMEAVMACEPDIIFIGGRLSKSYDALCEIAPVVFLSTDVEKGVVESTRISIHALREEGDKLQHFRSEGRLNFYPRPPRGGRHGMTTEESRATGISIHALREEGDSKNGEKHLRFCFIIKRSAQIWKSLSKNIRKNSCNLHRTA